MRIEMASLSERSMRLTVSAEVQDCRKITPEEFARTSQFGYIMHRLDMINLTEEMASLDTGQKKAPTENVMEVTNRSPICVISLILQPS